MEEETITSPSSFPTRITNVFIAPGELFTELPKFPVRTTSWVIPLLVSMCLALFVTYSLYSNPELRQQIYDIQSEAMKKKVTEGKMSQEQMERATDQMQSSGPGMFMLIGGGGAIVSIAIMYFGGVLVLWLATKFILQFAGGYKKILETFSLITVVGMFGTLLTVILMYYFNSLHATLGGALFILDSFDKNNFAHNLIASLNVFTLWQCGLLGYAFSKLSGKSFGISAGVVYGLWAVWTIVASLLGWVR